MSAALQVANQVCRLQQTALEIARRLHPSAVVTPFMANDVLYWQDNPLDTICGVVVDKIIVCAIFATFEPDAVPPRAVVSVDWYLPA